MLDDKTVESFERILGGSSEQLTEHASVIVDFISSRSEEAQVELMRVLIEKFRDPKIANGEMFKGRKISDARYGKLRETLEGMVGGTLKLIIHTRKSSLEASQLLRDLVFSFDEVDYRDYVLSSIMSDLAIPYVPVPESDIQEYPEARLQKIAEIHWTELCQLNCILRGGFGSTVTSNLLLKVIASVEPEEDRIGMMEILLARIIDLAA